MARPQQEPMSDSQFLPPLLRWLEARGLPLDLFEERFRLPPDCAVRAKAPLRMADWGALLEEAARQLSDPSLGLNAASGLQLPEYDLAELTARASPTLLSALERWSQYSPLVHERMVLALRHAEGESTLCHSIRGHVRGVGRHASEFALAWLLRQIRSVAGQDLCPLRVGFIHARPRDLAPLHTLFRTTELDFGCAEDSLTFATEQLSVPLATHDPRLLATVEGLAQKALKETESSFDMVTAVSGHVREQLAKGTPSLADIAERMHMSARTLQRRLEEQGVHFSELVDLIRADWARILIKDTQRSLTEIAFTLGFHDLATFSRAFRRWTGVPPGTYRRRA